MYESISAEVNVLSKETGLSARQKEGGKSFNLYTPRNRNHKKNIKKNIGSHMEEVHMYWIA